MGKMNFKTILIAGAIIIILLTGGFVVKKRGVPFVSHRKQWTIGIYRGNSPFSFTNPLNWLNPIFRAEDVNDVPAKFVADPFLIREGDLWYLFFEVYNNDTQQGDLAVATSKNLWKWNYDKVIIDEPFHLSYPNVFKWGDDYYLIPESFEANSVRLYKADHFPDQWSIVTTLVEGRDYVDNSIAYYHDKWWLFSSVTSNDTLYLFYAEQLTGPWTEHPMSPIVKDNVHIARPSGRMMVYEDRLYRYTMDIDPPLGTHQVMAIEITDISPTSYAEQLVQEEPILKPDGKGWNAEAMHQLAPVEIRPGSWVASVDGFGQYPIFGWDY